MRYWKVEMGNGYCGCYEEFVTTTEGYELSFCDCLGMYSYEYGAAGIEPVDDEEEAEESGQPTTEEYEARIADDSYWEEIDEEEFNRLVNEEDWEER